MNKIIVFQNQAHLEKFNFFFPDKTNFYLDPEKNQKSFFKILKKKHADFGMLIDVNLNVEIVFKKMGSWKSYGKFNLDLITLNYKKIAPIVNKRAESIFNFGKKDPRIKIGPLGIEYSEDFIDEIVLEKINLFLRNDLGQIAKNFSDKYGDYKFSYRKIKRSNAIGFDDFITKIKSGVNVNGVGKTNNYSFDQENGLHFFKSSSAYTFIYDDDNSIEIYVIFNSQNSIDNHYCWKSYLNNLVNNINLNMTGTKNMIKKSDLLLSFIGFLVFIFLTIITFTVILRPEEVQRSFGIIFSKEAYKSCWIYLLWINFLISFFFMFILMYILALSFGRRKPNLKSMVNMFIAAQIRAVAVVLTGQEILAMFLWGFYLVKKNQVRVSSLVGAIALIQVIRGMVTIVVGIPFMIIGQVYLSNVLQFVSGEYIEPALFYTLSWGGLIWFLIDKALRGGVVYIPPVHYIYNKIYTQTILFKKNPNIFIKMEDREMSLMNLKQYSKTIFTNRERLYRISLTVLLMIFIEALELMYVFNLVESAISINPLIHYNFLQLSGARYMITQINHFPVINIMPGNGIAIIEEFMNNTFEYIYLYVHGITSGIGSSEIAQIFSQDSTFILRFFNSYLKTVLQLAIVMFLVFKITIRRKF